MPEHSNIRTEERKRETRWLTEIQFARFYELRNFFWQQKKRSAKSRT